LSRDFLSIRTYTLTRKRTHTSVGGGAGSYASRSEGKNTSRNAAKYAQPQTHIITRYSLSLLLPFLSFSLSLSHSFCGSSAVRNLMLSIIARAHAHTPARMPTTKFDRYTNICIPVPAHGPADG